MSRFRVLGGSKMFELLENWLKVMHAPVDRHLLGYQRCYSEHGAKFSKKDSRLIAREIADCWYTVWFVSIDSYKEH